MVKKCYSNTLANILALLSLELSKWSVHEAHGQPNNPIYYFSISDDLNILFPKNAFCDVCEIMTLLFPFSLRNQE